MSLGIYARLSREDNETKSIENQIKSGKEVAKSLGLDHIEYKDFGVSGASDINSRPGLTNLIEDISEGKITAVFATNQDRLERNPEVWYQFSKYLKKNDIKLFFEGGKEFDFDDADSVFFSSLSSLINKRYIEVISKKSKAVIERNVKEGKVHGMIPYGYKKGENGKLVVDKEESDVVKEIFKQSLTGVGTNSIARMLNERGIKTRYAKIGKGTYKSVNRYNNVETVFDKSSAVWKDGTVRGIIKNTIYKGVRQWRGKEYKAPKILEPSYWEKVNLNLSKNANNSGKKVYHKYLLKGILRCGTCGRNMYGRTRENKKDNYYQCSSKRIKELNCGNRSINIDKIEGIIWSRFFKEGDLYNLIHDDLTKDKKQLEEIRLNKKQTQKEITELNKQINNIVKSIAKGIISDEDASSTISTFKSQKEEKNILLKDLLIQEENAKNSDSLSLTFKEEFESFTDNLSFLEKQSILNKYISDIYVKSWKKNINIYSLIIKFKLNIKDEEYVYSKNHNLIFSVTDTEFSTSRFFNNDSTRSYSSLGKDLLEKVYVFNDGTYIMPPFFIEDNDYYFIYNTILPYNNIVDWDIEKITNYFTENPNDLCKESGLSIYSIDKKLDNYELIKKEFQKFKKNDSSIKNWFLYFKKNKGFQ